jgi:hypothetical protein
VSAQLNSVWERAGKEQQQAMLSFDGQVFSALDEGRPELAAQLYEERAAALENSGRAQEAASLRKRAEIAQQAPTQTRNLVAMRIDASPGGKEFWENYAKRRAEGRAQAMAPAALRKAEADATGAEAEATTKGVTAKYAETNAIEALKKSAADLRLTNAQTNKTLAEARKLTQETQLALVSAATGDPAKRFDAEQKLRKEYADQTKVYTDVVEAHRRVQVASDNAQGDLSLVYGFMKMLDPGSVVREGEFATAQNAAGVPERVRNEVNRLLSGERLSPDQRKRFKAEASKLADSASKREGEVRTGLSTVVKSYGLNPENVFGSAIQQPAPPAPDAPTPSADGWSIKPKGGK